MMRARYFNWLYDQVFRVRDEESPISYVMVCTQMHAIHFNDSVPNDDNRTRDAEQLRYEFISTFRGVEVQDFADLHSLGKSTIFEVLIGLARRCDYIVEIGPAQWFRIFLENLGLMKYSDANFVPRDSLRIDRILRTFNDRTYSPSGRGGLFPLSQNNGNDQRHSELWFQMSAYMTENKMF
jgi:hypothetical protein